jgi:hypothetical protein
MGEAKRKKEAILNGACPCGTGKTAHLCCFTGQGWQWHKPPTILGLKSLPSAGRVDKCYMKELGSCVPPISGEHIISESVCRVLMGDGEFSISGVPWLEARETKIIAPPQANCLCRKHNSSLSPLDAAAHYFFASLRSYLEQDAGMRHALISGHDQKRLPLRRPSRMRGAVPCGAGAPRNTEKFATSTSDLYKSGDTYGNFLRLVRPTGPC